MSHHKQANGRRCAICHKTNIESGEGVWGFAQALHSMNLIGTHAHVSCIRKWQKKIRIAAAKY